MILYTFVVPVALCFLSSLPLFLRRKLVSVIDLSIIIVPVALWNWLAWQGIGSQSLSNVVEVYLLSIVITLYFAARYFMPGIKPASSFLFLIGFVGLTVILRLTFPGLEE